MGLKISLPQETPYLKLAGEIYFNPSGFNDFIFVRSGELGNKIIPPGMKALARIYEVIKEKSYRDLALSLGAGLEQLFFNEDCVLSPCIMDKEILPIYRVGSRMFLLFKKTTRKSYSVLIAKKVYFRQLAKTGNCSYGVEVGSQDLDCQTILDLKKNLLVFPC